MIHYICIGGCKGVSSKPGVCQTKGCAREGHKLKECDCADGKHYGAFDDNKKSKSPEDKNNCC